MTEEGNKKAEMLYEKPELDEKFAKAYREEREKELEKLDFELFTLDQQYRLKSIENQLKQVKLVDPELNKIRQKYIEKFNEKISKMTDRELLEAIYRRLESDR